MRQNFAMPIFKKLLFYLFGVGLGILAVMFIFGDRDFGCSYFPNDRVLSDLRKKDLQIPMEIEEQMNMEGLDTNDINAMLLEGDIDFGEVERGLGSCKNYWISLERDQKKQFAALFKNCDSTATLIEIKM